ncbi:MAG: hypothetical protein A4E35_02142 [Methanoregula sp. PtaU1.Bin051]|nr:MAG: hypothetical protein A4E35_02142 [Methanoregula sp. PtaU1.Bin051]
MTVPDNPIPYDNPLIIDPTERVTNGGFESGDKSGWTNVVGNTSTSRHPQHTYTLLGNFTVTSQVMGGVAPSEQTLYSSGKIGALRRA